MRDEVLNLPQLDHTKLNGVAELRRAHQMLAVIVSGYIWQNGPKDTPQFIPRQVAVPLYGVARKLQLPPGMSYIVILLANWKILNPDKPLTMDNVDYIQEFPGGEVWSKFVKNNILIELAFVKAVEPLENILRCFDDGDEVGVTSSLEELFLALEGFLKQAKLYQKLMTGEDFFLKLVPYFASLNEANGFPEGIVYEGVSEKPIVIHNASAAQSPSVKVVDALLGIQLHSEREPYSTSFMEYMDPKHAQLIRDVQKKNFKQMVEKSTNEDLKRAYKKCVDSLVNFRSYHIQLVAKYVVIPSTKVTKEDPVQSKITSEGNTKLMSFLKGMRNDAKETFIQ